ncbi:MAG: fructose-6-phosphate aldolase [Bacteroidia bacterium]
MRTYYLMKVKGKAKIPDYIQLRDENLTLVGYFRPGRKERLGKIIKDPDEASHIQGVIDNMTEYGRMTKVELP